MSNRPDISPLHQQLFNNTRSTSTHSNTTQHTPFAKFIETTNRKLHSTNKTSTLSNRSNNSRRSSLLESGSESESDATVSVSTNGNSKYKYNFNNKQSKSVSSQQQHQHHHYRLPIDKNDYKSLLPHKQLHASKSMEEEEEELHLRHSPQKHYHGNDHHRDHYYKSNISANKYESDSNEEQYKQYRRPSLVYSTRSLSAAHVQQPRAYQRRAKSYSRGLKLHTKSSHTSQLHSQPQQHSLNVAFTKGSTGKGGNHNYPWEESFVLGERSQTHIPRHAFSKELSHMITPHRLSQLRDLHEADYLNEIIVLDVHPAFYLSGSIRVVEVVSANTSNNNDNNNNNNNNINGNEMEENVKDVC